MTTKEQFIKDYQPAIVDYKGTRKDEIWLLTLKMIILEERADEYQKASARFLEIIKTPKGTIKTTPKRSNFENG